MKFGGESSGAIARCGAGQQNISYICMKLITNNLSLCNLVPETMRNKQTVEKNNRRRKNKLQKIYCMPAHTVHKPVKKKIQLIQTVGSAVIVIGIQFSSICYLFH